MTSGARGPVSWFLSLGGRLDDVLWVFCRRSVYVHVLVLYVVWILSFVLHGARVLVPLALGARRFIVVSRFLVASVVLLLLCVCPSAPVVCSLCGRVCSSVSLCRRLRLVGACALGVCVSVSLLFWVLGSWLWLRSVL